MEMDQSITHLPRPQGHDPHRVTVRALLHLVNELGQLGVCPAAVEDLGEEGRRGGKREGERVI